MISPAMDDSFRSAIQLRDNGDLVGAAAALRVLAIDYPESPGIWVTLGGVYFDLGDMPDALHAFERAVHLSPRSELASLGLFHTLMSLRRGSDAKTEMDRFLRLVPESEEYRLLTLELSEGGYSPADLTEVCPEDRRKD